MFDVAHALGETFEYTVVVEDELTIECLADVDLNDVATHPCGQCKRFERILRHVAIGSSVADKLYFAAL